MDIGLLEKDVQSYSQHGTNQAGTNKFATFYVMYNITNPLPVSHSVLCSMFIYNIIIISHLANLGLSYGTIKTYLAAIRHLHISNTLPEPRSSLMPKLALMERGIRRVKSTVKSTEGVGRVHLTITLSILCQIIAIWSLQAHEFDIVMLWAACCAAFFGFFRMGELTAPTTTDLKDSYCVLLGDIAIDNPRNPFIVRIHPGHSKADKFSKESGHFNTWGRQGWDLHVCPVSALLAYLTVRGRELGPLFRLRDGRFLTKDIFVTRVRAALTVLGFDGVKYAGHSFRIGAATTAAEVGIESVVREEFSSNVGIIIKLSGVFV